MPDYDVQLEVNLRIKAKNEAQADDRAARVREWIRLDAPDKKWLLTEPAYIEVSVNYTLEDPTT